MYFRPTSFNRFCLTFLFVSLLFVFVFTPHHPNYSTFFPSFSLFLLCLLSVSGPACHSLCLGHCLSVCLSVCLSLSLSLSHRCIWSFKRDRWHHIMKNQPRNKKWFGIHPLSLSLSLSLNFLEEKEWIISQQYIAADHFTISVFNKKMFYSEI